MTAGIAIFVKTPGASPVKTRLAGTIGRAAADDWYRLSLRAVAETVQIVCALRDGAQAYWAIAETSALDDALWREFPCIAQSSSEADGLGERMCRVHTELVARHGAGMLLGADAPQLSPALLQQALDWIEHADARAVIGPARDGGFWLFGGNRAQPASCWTKSAYSRSDTRILFLHAMRDAGAWLELPSVTDVDTAADLWSLRAELQALPSRTSTQDAMLAWLEERGVSGAGDFHESRR